MSEQYEHGSARQHHCALGNHGWCHGVGPTREALLIYPQHDEVEIRVPQPEPKICGCACHPPNDATFESLSRRAAPGKIDSPLPGSPVPFKAKRRRA
jgi:hypothetical protein